MATFTLTITLGNAEMTEPRDVAEALHKAAAKIEGRFDGTAFSDGDHGTILDANGNGVGGWEVEDR